MMPSDGRTIWTDRRVTVMGLGRHGGGVGVTRWLARQGAVVTVTDLAPAEQLAESLAALSDVPVARYRLGEHASEDFRLADAVVVNPAVKPNHPLPLRAADNGVLVTSAIELFLDACPSRMIGVTGTTGKSTTASLIAHLLKASGRQVWLGGNIGHCLLSDLERMQPSDWVVVELSSFQLAWLSDACPLPHVAVITNCTPHHVDWHRSWEDYVAAKMRLLLSRRCNDLAVVNPYDPEVSKWTRDTFRKLLPVWPVTRAAEICPLRGEHQWQNVALAATVAEYVGCDPDGFHVALKSFQPLPHRLETVGRIGGVEFIDDSKATTPAAAIAALETISQPKWLLCGGRDAGVEHAQLAEAIVAHARGAGLYGANAQDISLHIQQTQVDFPYQVNETLDEAFAWCMSQAQSGDVVLLSPGATSLDQFADYQARGHHFRHLVAQYGKQRE